MTKTISNQQKLEFLSEVERYLFDTTKFGFMVCRYIACQFALESNFGTSNIAACNCNLCGMKFPSSRPTLAIASRNDHALYESKFDSIDDYVLWLTWFHFDQEELLDINKFRHHLANSSYCPSVDYVKRIDKIYSQYYSSKN